MTRYSTPSASTIRGSCSVFWQRSAGGCRRWKTPTPSWSPLTTAQTERAVQAIRSIFPDEMLSNPLASPGSGALFKVGNLSGINTLLHTYVLWLAHAGRSNDTPANR